MKFESRTLAQKYRPRRLQEVHGQPAAVQLIKAHFASGKNEAVLLVGPSGTGKTTVARILGAALVCTFPNRPCGTCEECQAVFDDDKMTFSFVEIDGARFSEKENMDGATLTLSGGGFFSKTCFIDEIHALDDRAADALLKLVEHPTAGVQFIAATTDLTAVRPALRKRCKIISFVPLSGAQSFGLLKKVCGHEDIAFEPMALDMIAAASRGSARESLIMLEQVAQQGPVTPSLVSETLAFGAIEPLVRLYDALLAGDANLQDAALNEWQAEPLRKAELIRDYLLYVFNFEVAVPRIDQLVDAAFYTVTADERARLAKGLRRRAGRQRLEDYWLALLEAWQFDPAKMTAATNVTIAVRKFHRLLQGPVKDEDEGAPPLPVRPTAESTKGRQRAFRSRSSMLVRRHEPSAGEDSDAFLSRSQAEAIYDAASFLPLSTGTLFNTRFSMNHAMLGDGTEPTAAALVSVLTHELGMRVAGWSGKRTLNWVYLHERRPLTLQTEMVLHLPPAAVPKVEEWLHGRLDEWCARAVLAEAWVLDLPDAERETRYERNRVSRHWRLVRRLWGGLDPQIGHRAVDGMKRPLLELLGVPSPQQRASGRLKVLRRLGTSRGIAPNERRKAEARQMKLISAFKDAAWMRIDQGWELREREARAHEVARRVEDEARVLAEWPGGGVIEDEHRLTAMAQLHEKWAADPRLWPRSWDVWW